MRVIIKLVTPGPAGVTQGWCVWAALGVSPALRHGHVPLSASVLGLLLRCGPPAATHVPACATSGPCTPFPFPRVAREPAAEPGVPGSPWLPASSCSTCPSLVPHVYVRHASCVCILGSALDQKCRSNMAVTPGGLQTDGGGEGTLGQSHRQAQAPALWSAARRCRGVWRVGPEWPSAHQRLSGRQEPGPGSWACFWGCPGCLVRACHEAHAGHFAVLGVPSRWRDVLAGSAGDLCGRGHSRPLMAASAVSSAKVRGCLA